MPGQLLHRAVEDLDPSRVRLAAVVVAGSPDGDQICRVPVDAASRWPPSCRRRPPPGHPRHRTRRGRARRVCLGAPRPVPRVPHRWYTRPLRWPHRLPISVHVAGRCDRPAVERACLIPVQLDDDRREARGPPSEDPHLPFARSPSSYAGAPTITSLVAVAVDVARRRHGQPNQAPGGRSRPSRRPASREPPGRAQVDEGPMPSLAVRCRSRAPRRSRRRSRRR